MTEQLNIQTARAQLADANVPAWLRDWQAKGAAAFASHAWPTRKTENWKYTSLKSLLDVEWQCATNDSQASGIRFSDWNEVRVDIINGHLRSAADLPDGVSLTALTDLDEDQAAAVLKKIDSQRGDFLFDSLNQSMLAQIWVLKIEPSAQVSAPIHLNYVSDGDSVMVNTQLLIDVGAQAKATVVETFDHGQGSALVNANTTILVGQNANLTHYHLLLEQGDVRHVGRVAAVLARSARLSSFHMATGGVMKRKDVVVRHKGEGAELSLNGVYLPTNGEHIDYHTTLEHEVPHCHSEEIFRGIIGEKAKAVFNGRIHIHKDAQKSIAEMNNRNLLLSATSEVNTKPELEIYADDVRCAHGATIAQLDEKQLFYFTARGISRAEAEVMLSFGFINELLDALADEPVQLLLRPLLAELFARKREELVRHIL